MNMSLFSGHKLRAHRSPQNLMDVNTSKKEGFKKQVPSSLAAFLFFSLGPEQGQRHHEIKDYTHRFLDGNIYEWKKYIQRFYNI